MRPGILSLPPKSSVSSPLADLVSETKGMGPASLQEDRELRKESKEEMESYRCLLQAGSQLESTLQREYT